MIQAAGKTVHEPRSKELSGSSSAGLANRCATGWPHYGWFERLIIGLIGRI